MTQQLLIGGIALAGVLALSLGRKGDTEDEVIDAVANAAIAALEVDKDALKEVLADAVEQGDEGVMVIVIEEIGVIDDKIADIVDDAVVSKEVKNQRKDQEKQTTQTTQTTTTVDPQIAIRANDHIAYNNAVAEMRKSPELWVFFKVPPYVYGEWRGPMMENTLDAERDHRDALERQAAQADKNKYTSQLGAYRNSLLASGLTASEIAEYFKPLPWQFKDWVTLLAKAWDDAYQNWDRDRKQIVTPGVKTPEQLSQEAYDKFVLETDALLADRYPAGSYVMYWEDLPWSMGWDTDPDWLSGFNENYEEATLLGREALQDLATARQVASAAAPPRSKASLMDEARFQAARTAAIAQWGDDFEPPIYIEGNWEDALAREVQTASQKNADRVMAERRQQAEVDRRRVEVQQEQFVMQQAREQQERENRERLERESRQRVIDAEIEQADRDAYNDAKLDLSDEFPAERDLINLHMSGYRADWRQFQGQIRSELINETSNKERAAQAQQQAAETADRSNFRTIKSELIYQYPAARGQLNQWTYSPDWHYEQFEEKNEAQSIQNESNRREQDLIRQSAVDEMEAYQRQLADERALAANERALAQALIGQQRRSAQDWRLTQQRIEAEAAQEIGDQQAPPDIYGMDFGDTGVATSSAADVAAADAAAAEEDWADAFFNEPVAAGGGGGQVFEEEGSDYSYQAIEDYITPGFDWGDE